MADDSGDPISNLIGQITRMFDKVWETKGGYEGHQVAVRLSQDELKLYIDGDMVDSIEPTFMPDRDVTLVRGSIREESKIYVVEVFGKSVIYGRPKIKICVDGNKIAGDEF